MIAVLISTVAFVYYSFNTYIRWQDHPIILGFDEQVTDIFQIPFPAISICSNIKFDVTDINVEDLKEKYYNYRFKNTNELDEEG
jgi:amiloride-sensitive sodium channel